MALRKIIEVQGEALVKTAFGVVEKGNEKFAFNAYIKVAEFNGTKSSLHAIVEFSDTSLKFTKQYQIPVSVDANSENFIKQAYNYLKTLPEFEGATDC